MPQKPDLRSRVISGLLLCMALLGCGEKYPPSACTGVTSVTWDRREFGCSVEWSCTFGEYLIDCDFADPDYTCRCFADGEEVGTCSEANFCDHTNENTWVREVNACCGFEVVATDFAD